LQGTDRATTDAKNKEVSVENLLKKSNAKKKTDGTWFIYILRCGDGTLYTGITNNILRRLDQHNAGTASRYTRSRLPVELVYQEAQASRSHALKRELAIKSLSRQEKETLINTVESDAQPHNQKESVMAKIPSSKFSTANKKIASAKFPTAKRKLSSSKPASQSAKIPSRKFPKAKKVTKKVVSGPAPLGHPTDEQSRQEAVATLKSRTDALKAVKR